MLSWTKTLDVTKTVLIKDIMCTDYRTIYPDDSIHTVIMRFNESKTDTLPVVDYEGKLVGVFPRRHLYKALLECSSWDDLCTDYIVFSPYSRHPEDLYDCQLVEKVMVSTVGNAPVTDSSGNLVGIVGKHEYLREALNLLVQSNALFESLFQTIHEGLIVTNNHGYIIFINSASEQMLKINNNIVSGRYIEEILPQIDFCRINFENRRHLSFKCSIRSVKLLVRVAPIIQKGSPIGLNFVFNDLSELEKIAEELESTQRLQTILNSVLNVSQNAIFVTDNSGIIRYINEIGEHLTEKSKESILGKAFSNVFPAVSKSMKTNLTGIPEVDICQIKEQSFIVSHAAIKMSPNDVNNIGVVSTFYSSENKLIEEISRKWFSLQQQVRYYRDEYENQGPGKGSFDKIITQNETFNKLKMEAKKIARSSSTVLLTGESGVGKDMFSRAIHAASPRSKQPFVKVNCAAIPETLLESELFGYASGSFTGALKNGKPGYFEQAHKGTIFLDEIGDMPLSVQVKILQVLQDKQFMRVGGTSPQEMDVRIIAATNRDLREAISRGDFREDLYYRLNVIEFNLPPLRARKQDILPLAETFIVKYNNILGTNVTGITEAAGEVLLQYNWPGNIRELENAMERAANYVWEGEIGVEHLPSQILVVSDNNHHNLQPPSYKTVLQDVDKVIILDALKATDGNRSAAARLLNISRSSFYEKLAKYGLM